MAFTPKTWQDSPSTATPISAAALQDLETRLSAYSEQVVPFSLGSTVLRGSFSSFSGWADSAGTSASTSGGFLTLPDQNEHIVTPSPQVTAAAGGMVTKFRTPPTLTQGVFLVANTIRFATSSNCVYTQAYYTTTISGFSCFVRIDGADTDLNGITGFSYVANTDYWMCTSWNAGGIVTAALYDVDPLLPGAVVAYSKRWALSGPQQTKLGSGVAVRLQTNLAGVGQSLLDEIRVITP